jgi:hypothetical protein
MVVGTKSNHALGLAANGVTQLTVTPEGYLGIGSTAPDNAEKWTRVVDVYGGGEPRMSVRATLRTATVEGRVTVVGDEAPRVPGVAEIPDVPRMERGMFVGTKTAHALGFMTSGAPQMFITSDGHLGIGADRRFGQDYKLDNPDKVGRLVQVYGKSGALLTVRAEQVEGRIWAADNLWPSSGTAPATPGMIIGTRSNHPLGLVTGGMTVLTVGPHQVVVSGELYADRLAFRSSSKEFRFLNPGDPLTTSPVGAPTTPSDARLKTAVRPLSGALRSVLRLTGLRYRWGDEGLDHLTRDVAGSVSAGPGADEDAHRRARDAAVARARAALDGDDIGLLAQDVERVVPEVVHDGPDGYKYIRYGQLTALLVEAVKEQQQTIDRLEARVEALVGGQGR